METALGFWPVHGLGNPDVEWDVDHAVVDELNRLPASRLFKLDLRIPYVSRANPSAHRGISGAFGLGDLQIRSLTVIAHRRNLLQRNGL